MPKKADCVQCEYWGRNGRCEKLCVSTKVDKKCFLHKNRESLPRC